VKIDQATIENVPGNGLRFGLNASNLTEVSPSGDVVSRSSIAVGTIDDLTCDEFGCVGTHVADCYPTGNPPFVQDLPSGALQFGPLPETASLQAMFDCSGLGGTFQIDVDVTWTPDDNTIQVNARGGPTFWPVPVTGSVSDGTREFLLAGSTGAVIERTDHFVDTP
jgi:hypothetical protein